MAVLTSSSNPEKLERIHRLLPQKREEVAEKIVKIRKVMASIVEDYEQIAKLLDDNELVNARRVAEYDEDMRDAFETLLSNDSLDLLDSQLDDCETALAALSDYYVKHYRATIEKKNM